MLLIVFELKVRTNLIHKTHPLRQCADKDMKGPAILKSEIKSALKMIKRNRELEPDGISIEMLSDDFGINMITIIL